MPTEADPQFDESPSGWAQRWAFEFKAARKALEEYHRQGDKIIERFLDERGVKSEDQRWNLFTANVQTQEAMLFGQTPAADVSRRFADSKDELARVGAEMMERLLNTDLQHDDQGEVQAYRNALGDRLRPGGGCVRYRYTCEFGEQPEQPAKLKLGSDGQPVLDEASGQPVELAPAVPAQTVKTREGVEACYVYWKDQLWDAGARTFQDCRWWAFLNLLSREQLVQKFGEDTARVLPLNAKKGAPDGNPDAQRATPWDRCEVWEVWDKEHRKVFWYVEGYPTVLRPADVDAEDVNPDGSLTDPLGLDGFWPFPRPLMANLTTSRLVPKGDYHFAQDLYNEIDTLSTRIVTLERCIAVKGVYDQQCAGLDNLIESGDNKLIPVPSWAALSERGGLAGAIQWMPLEAIVDAINQLDQRRSVLVAAMQQITGWSDLVRGQQQQNGTPGEAQVKARFASVRLQALLDDFIRFVGDGQRIKAEIISKHFDIATIIQDSNALRMFESPELVQRAAQFLKDELSCYRIAVKPDSVAMVDFDLRKAERTELLSAIGAFFQQMMPLLQAMPQALPFMLSLLQWAVSGLKGSGEVQGIINQAIAQAEQAQQQAAARPPAPAQPDPKLMAAQMKAQSDAQKIQIQAQADLQHMNAETAALEERDRNRAALDIQKTAVQEHMKRQNAAAAVSPFGPMGGGL